MKSIVGRKAGMTQVFAADGQAYAVTVIEVLPNVVVYKKTKEKEGYDALQIAYDEKKESRANKCEKGIARKANIKVPASLHEIRGDELMSFEVGSKIDASLFKKGDRVDLVGTSKGKGFTGSIKRYHHIIGPKGHGSGFHRGPGSFANNGRCNNRVIPGKKMAGHAGNESVTILNSVIIDVNVDEGYILVKGGVPGAKKSFVTIRTATKALHGKPEVVKDLLVVQSKPIESAPNKEVTPSEEKPESTTENKVEEKKGE